MKIIHRYISTIDVGQFRDIIQIIPPIDTSSFGNISRVFNTANAQSQYALVHPGGNARQLQQDNVVYDNIITVYIRYTSTLMSNWQLIYDGAPYTIHKSSNVDAKNRFTQLLCYSKKAG